MIKRIAPVVCLLACAAFSLSAQSTAGYSSISGVVQDASGSVVPGAKITVENRGQGIHRDVETNGAGIFSVPALVPGEGYSVTVAKSGFQSYELKDLQLQVGQEISLTPRLSVSSSATQIEVTSEAPLVEGTKTDFSTNIDKKQIMDLPINGRRVDSFVLLTPGVSNDGTFGLLTFRGVAGGNAFLVDGSDTTEQFYNENAGRTRIASQLSQDAVQEFQVLSATFSAEYGKAMGGVVNTVTRGGTNILHGTGYWFFRNRTLNARDRYATINPPEVRYQWGGSVGGAIKKDKLFFFLNTEVQRRNFPIASSLVRPGLIANGVFVPYSAANPNGCGNKATPAQCAAINTLLPRYFGIVPRRNDQELAFGKLDYRPNDRNSFSASFNFLHFLAPNGLVSAASSNNGSAFSSNANDFVRMRTGKLSWTSIPTSSIVNDARFTIFTDLQGDDFNYGLIPPGLGVLQVTVAGQFLGAGTNYLPRISPNETRFGWADTLSWTKGKHAMKFGFDIAHTEDYEYFQTNRFGQYTYATADAYALDFSGNAAGAKNWQTYAQGFGAAAVDPVLTDFAFFAQDQWRVTPKLTVNYGMRYEYTSIPGPPQTNPDYPQTGTIPTSTKEFMPRVGVAYSFDKQKMVIRAGYGIFFARYPGGLAANLYQNNAVVQTALSLTGATQAALGPVYPNILSSAAGAKAGTTVQFADPHMRAPYTEQGTAAIEKQLGHNIGLTASYIWTRGVELVGVRDLNVGPLNGPNATYTIKDAAGNTVGTFVTPTYLLANRVNKNYTRVLQDENGLNSYYNALAINVTRRFSKGFQASAGYTWAHEIDYAVGGGSNAIFFSSANSVTYNGNYKYDKGSGSLDQRHRLVFNFVEQPTFTHRDGAFYKYFVNNWQISAITLMAAGRPVTPTVSVADVPVAGAAFTNTLNGFGGNFRVPFLGTDYLHTPATYRVDARITKVLPISERVKAYLNFEVFNLTNTQVDTALFSQAYSERLGVLTPTQSLGQGSATTGFPDGTNARRAQVGARFVF